MSQDEKEILAKIKDVFEDTFTDAEYSFSEEIIREDIEEWDSLNHIRLLTALESSFDLQFDLDEIEKMSSVASILAIIQTKSK